MTKRTRFLISFLFVALLAGVVDDGFAGKKKKKKKKKGKKAESSQTNGGDEAAAPEAPKAPAVVGQIDKKLVAHDTSGARRLLDGEAVGSNVYLKIAEGRVLEQEGKTSEATSRLSAAANEAGTDPTPLIYLGEVHRRARNTSAARDAFTRAEQRARAMGSGPDALYLLGVALEGQGRHDEAITALEAARSADSRNAMVVYHLGVAHARKKAWSPAIDRLTDAIGIDSGIAYAYYYRGLAAGEAGRKDLLVNDLERFLAMAPNAPEAETARRFLSGL